jgi:glycerophosphoryl diester phosphodiesterase
VYCFEIVAHRGIHDEFPENTLNAFLRAIELGADAVELDVRLTSDRVPVVFHYFYLDGFSLSSGAIFNYSFEQLQRVRLHDKSGRNVDGFRIPTLEEVLETIDGRIGLEIEIKGPEPESAQIVADVLHRFRYLWNRIEVTSYEPMLLWYIQQRCPGLPTDLLFPRSEDWMKWDAVAYLAIQRARLAHARAVHLHPTQLSSAIVSAIQQCGISVHAHDVNDERSLKLAAELGIPRICTDRFQEARVFRDMCA